MNIKYARKREQFTRRVAADTFQWIFSRNKVNKIQTHQFIIMQAINSVNVCIILCVSVSDFINQDTFHNSFTYASIYSMNKIETCIYCKCISKCAIEAINWATEQLMKLVVRLSPSSSLSSPSSIKYFMQFIWTEIIYENLYMKCLSLKLEWVRAKKTLHGNSLISARIS